MVQGPRSNFEIGGGGGAPLVTRYWGGHKTPFRTTNIGEHVAPLLRGPCGSAVIFYSDVLHRVCSGTQEADAVCHKRENQSPERT